VSVVVTAYESAGSLTTRRPCSTRSARRSCTAGSCRGGGRVDPRRDSTAAACRSIPTRSSSLWWRARIQGLRRRFLE